MGPSGHKILPNVCEHVLKMVRWCAAGHLNEIGGLKGYNASSCKELRNLKSIGRIPLLDFPFTFDAIFAIKSSFHMRFHQQALQHERKPQLEGEWFNSNGDIQTWKNPPSSTGSLLQPNHATKSCRLMHGMLPIHRIRLILGFQQGLSPL
jgi:hypothetical protein